MAGDVTIGALQRLSFMPGLSNKDGGELIGGQLYYDVFIAGGNITNTVLSNVTINSLNYAFATTVITAAGNVSVLGVSGAYIINKTTGAATSVSLPAVPIINQLVLVKDRKGDADTNNITINGNGKLIDGGSTYIIGAPKGWVWLLFDGTVWNVVG